MEVRCNSTFIPAGTPLHILLSVYIPSSRSSPLDRTIGRIHAHYDS